MAFMVSSSSIFSRWRPFAMRLRIFPFAFSPRNPQQRRCKGGRTVAVGRAVVLLTWLRLNETLLSHAVTPQSLTSFSEFSSMVISGASLRKKRRTNPRSGFDTSDVSTYEEQNLTGN